MSSDPVREPTPRLVRPRRALVVAYHFPPEASIGTHRTLRLVRALVDEGWLVTVLTGTQETYSGGCTIDRDLLARVPQGVRVVRAPVLRPFDRLGEALSGRQRVEGSGGAAAAPAASPKTRGRIGRFAQRLAAYTRIPDGHVGWVLPAVYKGLAATARLSPDVIYSTAPPWTGQLVARMLATATRRPWVADFRDPWARAPWRESWTPAARRAARIMERWVVGRAEAVVFTTRTNLDEYAGHYGPAMAAKFHLVRNGCDRREFEGLTPVESEAGFTMLHAGSLYGGRKPTALLAALAALRDRGVIDETSFRVRQIGRVALNGYSLAGDRDRLGLVRMVEILPSRPRRDILREMVSASCLLLLQPGTTVSIPGKLFEYLAAGRPILALAEEGETSEIVRASGQGVAVLPEDQPGIERAIESLVRRSIPLREAEPDLYDGTLRTKDLVRILDRECRESTADQRGTKPTGEPQR